MKKALKPLAVLSLAASFSAQAMIPEIRVQAYKTNVKGDILETMGYGLEPENWFNLSPVLDQTEGVSTDRAYQEFGAPAEEMIVAVIDSGVDVNHEDLQGKIWINQNEIPGNGIDDDNNGYIDDVFGWNFIGNEKGMAQIVKDDSLNGYQLIKGDPAFQVEADTLEVTREVVRLKKLKEELNSIGYYLSPEERKKLEELSAYVEKARANAYSEVQRNFYYNTESDTRAGIVKDNIDDKNERAYGNNDVTGPDSSHGTHVAGIIAAARDNGLGVNGVASNVKIMAIRTVPNGDERDKDVANSIYYAVDNGAKVINMSFGKAYSPYKEVVDKAVSYAESKGVLLVHAAGNSYQNNDTGRNFPNKYKKDKYAKEKSKAVSNWLEVGASSYLKGSSLVAGFSNYGKISVDVFAPGKNIHAPFPDNAYATISGTSMAAPVVAGVAAKILGHFPKTSPKKLREIITATSNRYPGLSVYKRGLGSVYFSELSASGGIVNLYNALEVFKSEAKVPFRMELANN